MNEESSLLERTLAETLSGDSSFLIRLIRASRQGHLCIHSKACPLTSNLIAEGGALPEKPVVRDNRRFYLQRNWVLETTVLEHLQRIRKTPPKDLFDVSAFILSPLLTSAQVETAYSVFRQSLTIVAGGPGTGKSFTAIQILDALVKAFRGEKLNVKIAAPTGKAADRLAQALTPVDRLEVETLTLHRLLQLQPGCSRLFEHRRIQADLIIVDEASMIDISLFAHLFKEVPEGCRLLLMGDADQLPPVDGSGIFRDLADVFAIRLQRSHRTQREDLHQLFEAVRSTNPTPLLNILEPMPQDLLRWIESEFQMTDSKNYENLRLICPLRKGPYGVDALNAGLLARLQKRLSIGESWSAPILVTGNDPHFKVYNGTPGIVRGIYQGGKLPLGSEQVELVDGRMVSLRQLPGYEFAFAISAHKSQGSEFSRVVCLLPLGSDEFSREALYTALTRAKDEVCLVGDALVLENMMRSELKQCNGILERLSVL